MTRARGRYSTRYGLGFAALLTVVVIGPLARLVVLAAGDDGAAFRTAIRTPELGRVLWTTVVLAFGSLLIALLLGTLLAWASTRLSRRFRWLSVVPVLPIVIPSVASVTGWVFVLSPRTGFGNQMLRALPGIGGDTGPIDIFSVTWIVIITGIGLTSFVYVFARTGLGGINHELVEAARVAGSTERRAFLTVVLPLLRPSLLYGGGVALILGLGQFTTPLLLGTRSNVRVLTTEMYRWTSSVPVDFGVAAAIGSPLLVVGVLGVAVQRRLLRGQDRFVTHSGRAIRPVNRSSPFAVLVVGVYGLTTVLLPLAALIIVAFSPYYSASIDWDAMTLDNFRQIISDPLTKNAITTSVRSSLAGVAIVLPIAYVSASIIHAGPQRSMGRLVDFIVNLPLSVPAVVFGAGIVYVYSRPPLILYGTNWILVLSYAVLMLPFATRVLLTGRISLGDQYVAASRTSGAGPLRTQVSVMLPLMRGSLAAAAGLTFVLMSHEFAASLLVRSRRTDVMGTRLYDLFDASSYPLAAAMAVVMVVVTTIGLLVTVLAGEVRKEAS